MSDPQTQTDRLPETVAAVTAAIIAAYGVAQVDLIGRFAALIRRYRLGDLLLVSMRKSARAAAAGASKAVPVMVADLVGKAAEDGFDAAGPGEPTRHGFGVAGDSFESHAERSARAIREDLEEKLNGLNYRLTRYADDVYRAVTADAAVSQVLGATPAQAQHQAYSELVRRGIDGFTDSKGRNWELSAYVEMAVRTAAQRAFNVSHLDRMQALGFDLFTVPGDGHPCPLCLPWEGAVLSVLPDPRATATIAEATAAGLFHPRCRHILAGYTPGVTEAPEPHEWTDVDAARYAESQQQRALERRIRAAKRLLAGALTPEMERSAKLSLRAAQADMRTFIDRTGRTRISRREQLAQSSR